MNINEETALVVQLFSAIKDGRDPVKVTQIIKQIEEWEKTDKAWIVCNNILRDEGANYGEHIYFSATNILYQKLKKQFITLPASAHEDFKNSLMAVLKGFCARLPRLLKVSTKLSSAIAVLALQMESWSDPIGSIIRTFGQDAAGAQCALYAIMGMPSEAKSATIRVGRQRRAAFTQYLQSSIPAVFSFVQSLLSSGEGASLGSLAFRCLHEWLAAGDVQLDFVLRSPLTPAMFVAMNDRTLMHDAMECICDLTLIAKHSMRDKAAKESCKLLGEFLITQTIKLAPNFIEKDTFDNGITDYCRIFAEVGCVFIEYLAQPQPLSIDYARIGTALLRRKDQQTFSLCAGYFSAFAREMLVTAASPAPAFVSVLVPSALESALTQACLPDDYEELYEDEVEEIDTYRAKDVGHTLSSLCVIAGPELVFESILSAFETALATSAPLIEACLFALITVLRKFDIDETPELPVGRLITAVNRLPNTHTIRCEAVLAYCRCARWLPDTIVPQALAIVQRELLTPSQQQQTGNTAAGEGDGVRMGPQDYAAKGFHELCKTCPSFVAPHAADLLRTLLFTPAATAVIPRKLGALLLKGFREVAAYMEDDDTVIVEALKALCNAAVTSLRQQPTATVAANELKCIAQAFKYLRPNSGIHVVPVFAEVLGVLETVAQSPALCTSDEAATKQLCRCCSAATVAAGGTVIRPLLPRVLRMGGLLYKARPRACVLDMLAALVATADLDADISGAAKGLFVETFGFVTQTTLDIMKSSGGAAAVNSPDVFKSYYDLAHEAVKALKYAVVSEREGLARILEMALDILRTVQERNTVESVTRFLERLFYTASIQQQCRKVMEAHVQRMGQQLVHTIICCACGWQPQKYISSLTLVFFSFRKFSQSALLCLAANCLGVPLQGALSQNSSFSSSSSQSCGAFPFPVDMDARKEFLSALESAVQSSDICAALNQLYFVAESS